MVVKGKDKTVETTLNVMLFRTTPPLTVTSIINKVKKTKLHIMRSEVRCYGRAELTCDVNM